jgi:hypothetical protein
MSGVLLYQPTGLQVPAVGPVLSVGKTYPKQYLTFGFVMQPQCVFCEGGENNPCNYKYDSPCSGKSVCLSV